MFNEWPTKFQTDISNPYPPYVSIIVLMMDNQWFLICSCWSNDTTGIKNGWSDLKKCCSSSNVKHCSHLTLRNTVWRTWKAWTLRTLTPEIQAYPNGLAQLKCNFSTFKCGYILWLIEKNKFWSRNSEMLEHDDHGNDHNQCRQLNHNFFPGNCFNETFC